MIKHCAVLSGPRGVLRNGFSTEPGRAGRAGRLARRRSNAPDLTAWSRPNLQTVTRRLPEPIETIARYSSPFQIANSYGLFAVMTTSRLEIVIEGSNDGAAMDPLRISIQAGRCESRTALGRAVSTALGLADVVRGPERLPDNPWFVALVAAIARGLSAMFWL